MFGYDDHTSLDNTLAFLGTNGPNGMSDGGRRAMEYDEEKVDHMILALLYLTLHDGMRAWKGFDFDALDRLYEKGLIDNPKNTSTSIVFTEDGLTRAQALFETHFGMPPQRDRE